MTRSRLDNRADGSTIDELLTVAQAGEGRLAGRMHRPPAGPGKQTLGGRLTALALDAGELLTADRRIERRTVSLPDGGGQIDFDFPVTGPAGFLAAKVAALGGRQRLGCLRPGVAPGRLARRTRRPRTTDCGWHRHNASERSRSYASAAGCSIRHRVASRSSRLRSVRRHQSGHRGRTSHPCPARPRRGSGVPRGLRRLTRPGSPRATASCPFTGPVELGRCAGFDLGRRVGEACRRVGLIFGL